MSKTSSHRLAAVLASGLALFVPVGPGESAAVTNPQSPAPEPPGPTTTSPVVDAETAPAAGDSTLTTGSARPAVEPRTTELDLPSAPGARTAQLAARATQRFTLVGITWPYQRHSEQVIAQVRIRRNGTWTPWQRLHVEDEHGPDPGVASRGRSGTEPLWVGDADGVQASLTTVDGTALRGGKVALIDPGTSPDDDPESAEATTGTATTEDPAASPIPFPMPRIITRRGWGADESLRGHNGADCAKPHYTRTIRAAFVHHTAGTNDYTKAQSFALVRSIYAYHVKSRGWCDLGYNFLVDKYGQAFEGRYGGMHLPVHGAHTGDFNTDSFGISLMGNYQTVVPGPTIMEATARVIAWKLDANYRSPHTKVTLNGVSLNVISGHRDTKATACPGKNVYSRLPALRSRVSQLMGYAVSTEIYRFAQQLGGESTLGAPYWGEHLTSSGRSTWFANRDLYWSPATGANSVYGRFRTRYRQLGYSNGPLGLPASEEQDGRLAGSRVQEFSHKFTRAALYWSRATGAQPTYGVIMLRYVGLGAELSRLKLPTTTPYAAAGGLAQEFQGGRIRWISSSNSTIVTYR